MKHQDIAHGRPVTFPSGSACQSQEVDRIEQDFVPVLMQDAVVIYETPDRRPFRRRLAEWWSRRYVRTPFQPLDPTSAAAVKKPEWPTHRALLKYL